MKRNITRIMLVAFSAVLTLSMVLGLAGCAASGPSGFAAAEKLWKEAATKSVKDDVTVSALVNLGNTIGTAVTLNVNFELERKYKADGKVNEITGKIKTISITGINPTITNMVPTILGMVGMTLPEGIDINEIIGGGNITLANVAEGKIKVVGTDYVLTGSVDVSLIDFQASTEDLEEDITVPIADVASAMADLGINIPFDLLTIYGIKSTDVTKENKASFEGEAGLNHILTQVYALIDNLFDGNVEFDGEEIIVSADVENIVDGIFGGTSSDDIKAYLFGDNGKIDLGDVELDVTYEGKKFKTISGTQTMSMGITKTEIIRILNINEIKTALDGLSESPKITPSLVNSILNTLGIPATIEATVTVTFTSTYTY